jgi:6-phosphogluconolactonase
VNPSYLVIDRRKQFLYAVNEVSDFGVKPSGAVSAFAIHPATGNLRFLNQQASMGADPCYLSLDRNRKRLLVANYTGGSIAVLPIDHDGTVGIATDLQQHEGSGPKEQQKTPHAHCIILDRFERYALATDLGTDKLMIYRFNERAGKLSQGNQRWVSFPPGTGPRHVTLHPSGKFAYVINELNSTLTALTYEGRNGALSEIETVSTLPSDFAEPSYCADVHISTSGKYLYGSNRGHDSIVVFAIDGRTGKLEFLEHVSTAGKWPRNFTIDPSGKFLLVANQRSDNVVTFRIDGRTGRLKATGQVAEIPAPVCLRFA